MTLERLFCHACKQNDGNLKFHNQLFPTPQTFSHIGLFISRDKRGSKQAVEFKRWLETDLRTLENAS